MIVSSNNCYHAATGSSSIFHSPKAVLSLHLAMAALIHNFFSPLESSMKPHPVSPHLDCTAQNQASTDLKQ